MSKPTDQCVSSVEAIDMQGDVIIVVQGSSPDKTRRFLVSTKVLGLASPVFLKLLGPRFLEGQQLAKTYRPEIALYQDSPAIMGVIFTILHYQEPEVISKMSTQWLVTFAIHCDKYNCTKALWPRAHIWLQNHKQEIMTPQNHGNLLLAAYLFRDSKQFTALSREAQLKLPVAFSLEWEKSEILNSLPDTVTCRADEHIQLWPNIATVVVLLPYKLKFAPAITEYRNTFSLYRRL
ncbi:uncharacterized protein N7503_010804 [Penicillium pulvis]|uniref:uncharacterized protein n=1 Tax=Penicillium pulvis TaxID=1562058 RepID=UPI00254793D7|nr:uncharacterized protein N7503_010804 [Penicillium pulvis]KAJ5785592.1 hypothetical protein N7503_010804 [Penicillium pulvis]